jgi:hypothetical protein
MSSQPPTLNTNTHVTLQAPGAGIPWLEGQFAKMAVFTMAGLTSPEKSSQIFEKEQARILTLVEALSFEARNKQVLIARLPGLEDSSRYWSVWMVLSHLNQVNLGTLGNIQQLVRGEIPTMTVRTEDVKPTLDKMAPSASQALYQERNDPHVAAFQQACQHYLGTMQGLHHALKTPCTLPHPWFGPMNAHQWHFMMGFHMGLHRKQIQSIVAGL